MKHNQYPKEDKIFNDNEKSLRNCLGKGCNNTGIHYLTVILLKKSGWFCNDCAHFLKVNDLIYYEPTIPSVIGKGDLVNVYTNDRRTVKEGVH